MHSTAVARRHIRYVVYCHARAHLATLLFVLAAPKIDAKLSHIDWTRLNAAQIYNRWRATCHLFKLQTFFHGANVKLNAVEPPTEPMPEMLQNLVDVRPGRIVVDRTRNLLFVRCQEDNPWVAIRHVTLHRRPVMSALDFSNGYLAKKAIGQHYFDVP